MAKVYISEYSNLGKADIVAREPSVATQVVAIGGTSAQSSAFGAGTNVIRVHTDAVCSISIGENPTATADTLRMSAGQTEYFGVTPAHKIAVITNS